MDTGQVVISAILSLLAVIAWYIKRDINGFSQRLDRHDEILFKMTGTIQRLIGIYYGIKGVKDDVHIVRKEDFPDFEGD